MAQSRWRQWCKNPRVSYQLDDSMIIVRLSESGGGEHQSEWMKLMGADVDLSIRQLLFEIDRERNQRP